MIKATFSLALLLPIATSLHAQVNLIPNPSFETYAACPVALGEITQPAPWMAATSGSPDYFNSCSSTLTGVPFNDFGHQEARTGNAFAGFTGYSAASSGREYIETPLSSPLEADKAYYLEFYVSLADTSAFAISNIGAYLSPANVDDSLNQSVLSTSPQIVNLTGNYLSDKTGWMKISGTFIASGGEAFLTIGNFSGDPSVDTVYVGPGARSSGVSYYFVDDIRITETLNFPNVFSPNDDGINDVWKIDHLPQQTEIQIYNRWGILIDYESFAVNYRWNGRTTSGVECPAGMYYYLITSSSESYKGFIQLSR